MPEPPRTSQNASERQKTSENCQKPKNSRFYKKLKNYDNYKIGANTGAHTFSTASRCRGSKPCTWVQGAVGWQLGRTDADPHAFSVQLLAAGVIELAPMSQSFGASSQKLRLLANLAAAMSHSRDRLNRALLLGDPWHAGDQLLWASRPRRPARRTGRRCRRGSASSTASRCGSGTARSSPRAAGAAPGGWSSSAPEPICGSVRPPLQ